MASNPESNSKNDVKRKISTDHLKIKVEFKDQENQKKKIKTEVKEEEFEEHVQHRMEVVKKFLNESETQAQEGKNLIKGEFLKIWKRTRKMNLKQK